jgi:Tfp pilus assembly protein PilO
VNLTDRDRKILLAIVPIVVLVACWFLLLAPKREEAKTAGDELAKQAERLDAAKAAAAASSSAKDSFQADYADVVRLGKAIPAQVDMPSVLVQLDAAAAGTGIHFTKITAGDRQPVGAPTDGTVPPPTDGTTPPATNEGSESGQAGTPVASGGESAQSAPGAAVESANTAQATANEQSAAAEQSGVAPTDTQTSTSTGGGLPVGGGAAVPGAPAVPVAGTGLEAVPLNLEFVGNFFNLADFFHRMKRFVRVANEDVLVSGRLLTIDKVRWSSDSEIFPLVRAEITASIYLSPQAQGTTAGATLAGPAPTTPATTTTPAESAPAPGPAPTATATP